MGTIGKLSARLVHAAAAVVFSVFVALPGEAAVRGVGSGPQKRDPQQGGKPEPNRRSVGLERALQFSHHWFALTRTEQRQYAMKLAGRLDDGTVRPDEPPFVRAMWNSLAAIERRRLRRMNRSRRAARLTSLIQRYAGHVRLLNRIPADLDKMSAAGKIVDRKRAEILAIEDDRKRVKAFLRLREELLLRDMLAGGRIDRSTYRRVSALPAGRERSRALATMRARVVWSVNQHLLHVFLTSDERESLKRASRLHQELQRLEKKYRVRFLRITPSADARDSSRCLRLTRGEERAFAKAPGASAREALLAAVYQRQRRALIESLSSRSDRAGVRFLLRRIRSAEDPRSFYRRALRSRSRSVGGRR